MNHIQLTIKVAEENQEYLIALLADEEATGFEQLPNNLIAYFNENNFDKNKVQHFLSNHSFTTTKVAAQNWNQLWENSFEPVIVNHFCAIRADFHSAINTVQHEIIITPKMSFGTGHHATTYMMIAQMKDMAFTNKSVFDFGTGTGILSILAQKLGAAAVAAIDIDEWSITNASENFERNHCNSIHLYQSSELPNEQFDIILANINRNVILQHMERLSEALPINGQLLLSGLLISDEEDMVTACEKNNLQLQKRLEQNGWISLLLNKAR